MLTLKRSMELHRETKHQQLDLVLHLSRKIKKKIVVSKLFNYLQESVWAQTPAAPLTNAVLFPLKLVMGWHCPRRALQPYPHPLHRRLSHPRFVLCCQETQTQSEARFFTDVRLKAHLSKRIHCLFHFVCCIEKDIPSARFCHPRLNWAKKWPRE